MRVRDGLKAGAQQAFDCPPVRVGSFASLLTYLQHVRYPARLRPTIGVSITGEAHDNRLVTELLSDLNSGAMLLADRGYDADWIRAFAGEHGA